MGLNILGLVCLRFYWATFALALAASMPVVVELVIILGNLFHEDSMVFLYGTTKGYLIGVYLQGKSI